MAKVRYKESKRKQLEKDIKLRYALKRERKDAVRRRRGCRLFGRK